MATVQYKICDCCGKQLSHLNVGRCYQIKLYRDKEDGENAVYLQRDLCKDCAKLVENIYNTLENVYHKYNAQCQSVYSGDNVNGVITVHHEEPVQTRTHNICVKLAEELNTTEIWS